MRRPLIVFAGFLEAGKTTLINNLIDEIETDQKIVLIQCEQGLVEANEKIENIVYLANYEDLQYDFFEEIIIKYPEHLFLLEYNGTWPLSKLYQISLPKGLIIEQVIYVMDSITANLYLRNMSTLILEQIYYSDLLYFTKQKGSTFSKDDKKIEVIKSLKPNIKIISSNKDETLKLIKSEIINKSEKTAKGLLYFLITILIVVYLIYFLNYNKIR